MTDAMIPLAILACAAAVFYAFAQDTIKLGNDKHEYPLTRQLGKYLFMIMLISAVFEAQTITAQDWLSTLLLALTFVVLIMLWLDFLLPLIKFIVNFFTKK